MAEVDQRQQLLYSNAQFWRANEEAMSICNKGVNDYIALRCLLLNGLISEGLTIAAQGVEKLLKAQYRIRGGTKQFGGRQGLGHAIPDIADELRTSSAIQFDLSRFDRLFTSLLVNYELRYPDNWNKKNLTRWSRSSEEINEIDELILFLFDHFPIPREVNLLTCYFGIVADHLAKPDNPFLTNSFKWLCEKNETMKANWNRISTECININSIASPSP